MSEIATTGLTVAYVMSRFPRLTETFVVAEMLAMERAGVRVTLHPLLRERTDVVQPDAELLRPRAQFRPFLSRSIVASQLWWLRRHPRRYLSTVLAALRGTWRSPNFLIGAVGILPKVAAAAQAMQREGADHVHCHFANHPALAGYVIHRLTGLPYTFTAHGSDLHVDRTMLCTKAAAAHRVITISEDNRRLIEDTCPALPDGHVDVVRCGIDLRRFRPRDAEPPATPLELVCVGTLHEVKGQRHLVEALGALAGEGLDVRATFVGDGPDRARLQARVDELGLRERVRFAGRLTSDAVRDVLWRSHLLVTPSVPTTSGKREGIPVVLMEAMACGLPVVASRLSGIPEVVVDGINGRLASPGDHVALARAIADLAADPAARARMAREARATAEREFDVDANARRLRDIIEDRRASAAVPA